ncbi:MAG TPA: hypothetical protein VK400_18645 [Pyrinomonadaceae bacterium]|nr:hypothetical protein [Pyrinomonadaceae bacterium]
MKRILLSSAAILLLLIFASAGFAQQGEILTNAEIVEMARAGLGKQIILQKIASTDGNFDISAKALIELKKAGVEDEVIQGLIEKSRAAPVNIANRQPQAVSTQSQPSTPANIENKDLIENKAVAPGEALRTAKTIALVKSSLQPSRQALEKELLRRADWKKLNLTLVRYKESADLYVEIGYVSLSWITHRYVFRVYDRRSGAVLVAGETTSWGSLADNLAREISQKLGAI